MRSSKVPQALLLVGVMAIALACSSGVLAQVLNPGFDVPNAALTPPNYATSKATNGSAPSSAANWSIWNPTTPTAGWVVSTQLLPSTNPNPTNPYMIEVTSDPWRGGIFQNLVAPIVLPTYNWDVLVSEGGARLFGWNAAGTIVAVSSIAGPSANWQTLTMNYLAAHVGSPIAAVGIYGQAGSSTQPIRSVFAAELPGTAPVPEPSALAMIFGALVPAGGLALRRRIKR